MSKWIVAGAIVIGFFIVSMIVAEFVARRRRSADLLPEAPQNS